MTDPLRPGLRPVSHLKAGPTTSSSQSTALPASTQPPPSRPSSRLRTQRSSSRDESVDGTSEKATITLIRRVLCAPTGTHGASSPQPPEELLPPLTSSNDVDRQLYALLAIIIKEFVYSWYSKITPDQALVNEIIQVIAHCTRALEQRVRQVDVAQLVLDEIPALVEAHVLSYRLAMQQSQLFGLPTSRRALYHELNPHPGLSPVPDASDPETIAVQRENEAVYRRLLANGTLAVLLPSEDLENGSLRTLLVDILADLILGNEVGGRICEGWFFWETITKLAAVVQRRKNTEGLDPSQGAQSSRLERFGLLSTQDEPSSSQSAAQSPVAVWIWNILQSLYLGYVALRFITVGLFRVASIPSPGASHGASVSFSATPVNHKTDPLESTSGVAGKRPVLGYRVYSMVSQLVGIPERMPWLGGMISLLQHLILAGPGRLGSTDGVLDRFLRQTIEEYVLTPTLLPNLLLATRMTLFPANTRPSSQGAAVNVGTALAPQVPAQPPAPSQKAVAPSGVPAVPTIADGVRGPAVAGDAIGKSGKSNAPGNNHNNHDSGPAATATSPVAASVVSSTAADAPPSSTQPATANRLRPTSAEIAAIERRCAASLLAVIPPSVARTLFGVSSPVSPAPGSRDRTCSTTTGSSSTLTTTAITSPAPLSSAIEESGDHSRFASKGQQSSQASSSSASHSSSASSLPTLLRDGVATAHQPDSNPPSSSPEDMHLLAAIETDLLDLFADEYCNRHLIYSIIEVILAKILPEIADRSVQDLMEDRGVPPVPGAFQTWR
ncbi:hypothetical protein NUU61_009177 [Penicillium alfredii]|uniref:PXA domain-containing protein n=1 Tax=Penicillium alfredii TaxID=1506179 RepID=A0A9W9JWW7_9EURO|nr:uncharacterized protein NUU61_009177 [Penicillium alfredii]KAJ5084598.1 hypothetical protein NUU61_009177 [Penicillium alfredii]